MRESIVTYPDDEVSQTMTNLELALRDKNLDDFFWYLAIHLLKHELVIPHGFVERYQIAGLITEPVEL